MVSPGTALTLTSQNVSYQLQAAHKLAKSIRIQPALTNTGILTIGNSTLDMSGGTIPPPGVIAQLQPPQAGQPTPVFELYENDVPNGIDLANFYCSSSQDGDVVFWSYNEQ